MYSILFILITVGTLLFYAASAKVKTQDKPQWIRGLAGKPVLARGIGAGVFLIGWSVAGYCQGPGAGTFAMVAYLMGSYSLVVLLKPFRCFSVSSLAIVAGVAFFLETVIF